MLRATAGDEVQALSLLLKALEMRVHNRELLRCRECQVVNDARVVGRDRQDHPTILMSAKAQAASIKELRDQLVLAYEAGCEQTTEEGTIIIIADMLGFRPSLNCDMFALKDLSDTLGSVYADRLHQIVVVDFSWAAQIVWRLIKPMMSERTKKKFAFLSEKEAKAMVRQQFDDASCQRICDSFDMNRDPDNTWEDLMLHARRTAVGDMPLGSWETASCSAGSESTSAGGSGDSSGSSSW